MMNLEKKALHAEQHGMDHAIRQLLLSC